MRDDEGHAWMTRGLPPQASLSDHPHRQQINALIAVIAARLGALRARGVMDEDEAERALRTADAFLPEGSEALGLRLLAVVRQAGELAAGAGLPRAPLDPGGARG